MKNLYVITAYWRWYSHNELTDHQYCVGITSNEAVARECAAAYAANPNDARAIELDDDVVMFDVEVSVCESEDGVMWKPLPAEKHVVHVISVVDKVGPRW